MDVVIEACCGSVEEAVGAQEAGADRIELCAGLPTGGVTPSLGMLEEVLERVSLPVVFMVRPREGRACPAEEEFRAAVRDVRHAVRAGAHQVICGVLSESGEVDRERNRELVEAAEGRPVAFHRVFDMCPSLPSALEDLVSLGFCRVLTSGCPGEVDVAGLRELVAQAAGRIVILPGGGVREHNAARLVQEAGCRELHFSFRKASGFEGYGGVEDTVPAPERVRAIREIVAGL